MIKAIATGYALGLVAMFMGAAIAGCAYLGVSGILHVSLGYEWPWFRDVWLQTASVIISYSATVQVFNFAADKRIIVGWPVVATAFAGVASLVTFNVIWTDETLVVLFVTTAISTASGVYRHRYHNRLAKVRTA